MICFLKRFTTITVKGLNPGESMLMMASAQVVETSVNTNNSPSQDYTTTRTITQTTTQIYNCRTRFSYLLTRKLYFWGTVLFKNSITCTGDVCPVPLSSFKTRASTVPIGCFITRLTFHNTFLVIPVVTW